MNSCRLSMARTAKLDVEFVPAELASMPLMRTLLLVVRWPLTETVTSQVAG